MAHSQRKSKSKNTKETKKKQKPSPDAKMPNQSKPKSQPRSKTTETNFVALVFWLRILAGILVSLVWAFVLASLVWHLSWDFGFLGFGFGFFGLASRLGFWFLWLWFWFLWFGISAGNLVLLVLFFLVSLVSLNLGLLREFAIFLVWVSLVSLVLDFVWGLVFLCSGFLFSLVPLACLVLDLIIVGLGPPVGLCPGHIRKSSKTQGPFSDPKPLHPSPIPPGPGMSKYWIHHGRRRKRHPLPNQTRPMPRSSNAGMPKTTCNRTYIKYTNTPSITAPVTVAA